MAARPCASSSSTAGATCSGLISAKRGRPEKSSSGFRHFGSTAVLQQHGDGHRADAAGHRRDAARDFLHRVEVDVAGQLAVGQAVHADVDHAGAGFDHRRGDQFRAADRGDQDVGLARDLARDRAVFEWQMVTVASFCKSSSASGLPTMLERPIDHRVLAGERARPRARAAASRRPACTARSAACPAAARRGWRVEAVDVLGRRDRLEDARRVDVLAAAAAAPGCRAPRDRRSTF